MPIQVMALVALGVLPVWSVQKESVFQEPQVDTVAGVLQQLICGEVPVEVHLWALEEPQLYQTQLTWRVMRGLAMVPAVVGHLETVRVVQVHRELSLFMNITKLG
jgi:hypothetical protein